jgi:hypothetical protein
MTDNVGLQLSILIFCEAKADLIEQIEQYVKQRISTTGPPFTDFIV